MAKKLVKILTIDPNAFLNTVTSLITVVGKSGPLNTGPGPRNSNHGPSRIVLARFIFLGPGPGSGNNFVLGHPWIRSGVEFPVFEILFIIFVIFKK